MMPLLPLAAVMLALQTAAAPPPPAAPGASTAVARRAATPPVIDGKDNDEVWRLPPAIQDFRQGAKSPHHPCNFYVFVRAFDSHPDSIKQLLARRDVRICCDQIKIVID